MKNYFNAEERTRHIVSMAMQETLREFAVSDTLSDEERDLLTNSIKNLEKFNNSIFERMGDAYKRKVEKTMQANCLRLVGKYAVTQDCISHSASEDLAKCIKELRMYFCLDCEKCDFKNCGAYSMLIACDSEGVKSEKGCPFAL